VESNLPSFVDNVMDKLLKLTGVATKPERANIPFVYFLLILTGVVMVLFTLVFTVFFAKADPFTLQNQLIELRISQQRVLERRIDLNKCLVGAQNSHIERLNSLCEKEGKKENCMFDDKETQIEADRIYLTDSNECHKRYHH